MKWEDKGMVIAMEPLGDAKVLLTLLTETRGKHKGVWRRPKNHFLQPGHGVEARWNARLQEHLGTWQLDCLTSDLSPWLKSPSLLAALQCACYLACTLLPEREACPRVYHAFLDLMTRRTLRAYCQYELALVNHCCFPMPLTACTFGDALTLPSYVSPKTGRPVCAMHAHPYTPRLLPLPAFFYDPSAETSEDDIKVALKMTGYLLMKNVLEPMEKSFPSAREGLVS